MIIGSSRAGFVTDAAERDIGSLPVGFSVALDRRIQTASDGLIVVGGSPTRVVRFTQRARNLVSGDRVTVRDRASAVLADRLLDGGLAHPVLDDLPPVGDEALTVVVPVYNRQPSLDRLLAALALGERVVVVDDGSVDPALTTAVAERHGARAVQLPVNAGVSAARNAGMAVVKTPLVAFVDSDVVCGRDELRALARHFADPRVGLVAPRIQGVPVASASWVTRYESARSSLDLGPDPGPVRPGSRIGWVPGACTIARVAALVATDGGYDELMRTGEDVDLVWRLHRAGWRVRYEPSVTVQHDHRTKLVQMLRRKHFYGSSADQLARRHGRDVAPAVLHGWTAALTVAVLAQRRWSIPAAVAVTAAVAVGIARKVPEPAPRSRIAARLAVTGAVDTISQLMALLLRHWWPVTALTCLGSRRMRRAALVAALADGIVEFCRLRPELDLPRFLLLRRLDDLAYGSGVWTGAIRGRSTGALRLRLRAPRRG